MQITGLMPIQNQNQILKRFLSLSVVLHVFGVLYLLLKSLMFPDEPKVYLPSIRVDLVGLPSQKLNEVPAPVATPAEKPKPAPAAEPKTEVKPDADEGEISLSKKKKKKQEHAKKEKEAQKKLKQALERIKAIERIKALAGGDEIRGNRVSKGSALTGEAKTALETTYFDVILERVRANWELPKWIQDQSLNAKVVVYLDGRGNLKSFRFSKTSGNEQFDSEVKRTLQASSPFPVPPGAIASDISGQGILLGFPL
jgi:outer membrane biosynthesis protein TonB